MLGIPTRQYVENGPDPRWRSIGSERAGVPVFVIETPLTHAFRERPEPFMYEPIALFDLWVVRYLFSPLNLLFGLAVSVLVGLNLALSSLAISRPTSCGMESASGVLASVPALLASSTCCAPILLLILGGLPSALLTTVFAWLLPVGAVSLVGSLVYLGTRIDPDSRSLRTDQPA